MFRLYFSEKRYKKLRAWFELHISKQRCDLRSMQEFFNDYYQASFRWTSVYEEEAFKKDGIGYLSTVLEFESEQEYLMFCLRDNHNLAKIIKEVGYFKQHEEVSY